jgi:hypothetical protein
MRTSKIFSGKLIDAVVAITKEFNDLAYSKPGFFLPESIPTMECPIFCAVG